jgi:hypothetical protein
MGLLLLFLSSVVYDPQRVKVLRLWGKECTLACWDSEQEQRTRQGNLDSGGTMLTDMLLQWKLPPVCPKFSASECVEGSQLSFPTCLIPEYLPASTCCLVLGCLRNRKWRSRLHSLQPSLNWPMGF